MALDEPGLTLSLLERTAGGAATPWETTARARALVLAGRAGEALTVLSANGVRPPDPGAAPTGAQVVLAAAHAALGDPDAYGWLLRLPSQLDGGGGAWLARLVAAVADARQDAAMSADAWQQVVFLRGAAAGSEALVRAAAASVAQRDRNGPASSTEAALLTALELLVGTGPLPPGARDPGTRAAELLRARGDVAGARLLLRAWRGLVPRRPELDAALRSVTPPAARWAGAAGNAVVVLTVLAALGLSVAVRHAVPGLVISLVVFLWRRFGPTPGLTREEALVDQRLSALHVDPDRGVVIGEPSNNRGWYGVAGIGGAIVGFVCAGMISATPTGQQWSLGLGAALLWLGIPAVLAAAAVWGARALHVGRRGSTRVRRGAEEDAARAARASACVCWRAPSLVGDVAAAYAQHHLVDAGEATVGALRGGAGRVASCPQTAIPWLVGPLGDDGRWLALRGALPDGGPDQAA